jgi:hypothetical protein
VEGLRSVPQLVEDSTDDSARPRLLDWSGHRFPIANGLEYRFYFSIERKATDRRFGKDQCIVHKHIELSGFTRRDFGGFAEAPFK